MAVQQTSLPASPRIGPRLARSEALVAHHDGDFICQTFLVLHLIRRIQNVLQFKYALLGQKKECLCNLLFQLFCTVLFLNCSRFLYPPAFQSISDIDFPE